MNVKNTKPSLITDGFFTIIGVDEAGRGALAGPVLAAALILPNGLIINEVKDSKKLSAKKRNELACEIKNSAVKFAFGYAYPKEIDEINILNATMNAMKRAIDELKPDKDTIALIDGNRIPKMDTAAECIVKGDQNVFIIAAASILVKVERDKIMDELAKDYPEYGLNKHKGYATKMHYEAIREFGITDIHRKSFRLC